MNKPNLSRYLNRLDGSRPAVRVHGRVRQVTGLMLRATVPGVTIGELVEVETSRKGPLQAQVVGFKGEEAVLMPLGSLMGVGPDSPVKATGEPLSVMCGQGLLGRVLDGLGRPMDGLGPIEGPLVARPLDCPPPDPMRRRRIDAPFETGVRAIDGLLTLGEGQRVGLFAGSGVGKSSLLGHLARSSSADVNVICLVGERGRELRDFLEGALGDEGRQRSVVVCATSDAPGLLRIKAALVATSIAEHFRQQGKQVLLMMDSVTRLAQAQREVGLTAGEPPVRQGYPPSAFSLLPKLMERVGNDHQGSITAIYTVLVPGDDLRDPIADEVRSILDGHIVLSRALAERAHWPAIDVLQSLSRLMRALADKDHLEAAEAMRRALALHEERRDLISLGAYQHGDDPSLDEAIELREDLDDFLQQDLHTHTPMSDTVDTIMDLMGV